MITLSSECPQTAGLGSPRPGPSDGRSRLRELHLDDDLDLDRDGARQLSHAYRRARMAAGVAEDLDEQVGEAVDHERRLVEPWRAVHHPERLNDLTHLVQAAQL